MQALSLCSAALRPCLWGALFLRALCPVPGSAVASVALLVHFAVAVPVGLFLLGIGRLRYVVGVAAEPGQAAYPDGSDGMSRYTSALVSFIGQYGYTDTVTDILERAASAVERAFGEAQRPVTHIHLAALVDWVYFPGVCSLLLLHDSAPGRGVRVGDVVKTVLDEHERQVRCGVWYAVGYVAN
jgi:hypothetical protein